MKSLPKILVPNKDSGLLKVRGKTIILGTHTMRIVNGRTENYGAVPYLCQLTSYGDHNCGTSIISPKWNIGAAHCVTDYDTPEQFRLICGSHHR